MSWVEVEMSWVELGVRFSNTLLKFVRQVRICLRQHSILAEDMFAENMFVCTMCQGCFSRTLLDLFNFHYILESYMSYQHQKLRFQTGKRKGTSFQTGKYAQHMLISSTDSRLNMLISTKLIKKTCKTCNNSYISYMIAKKKRKKKELEVTFFDGNIYLYNETRSFDEF